MTTLPASSSSLAWLTPSPDHFGHLDFWVHTTFGLRSRGRAAASEETAAMDFPPNQMTALREWVRVRIDGHLNNNLRTDAAEFLGPLEDFVLVQRLARAAFAGELGRDFPLQKLFDLERETRFAVPRQATVRWEPKSFTEKSLTELTRALNAAREDSLRLFEEYFRDLEVRNGSKAPVCDPVSR